MRKNIILLGMMLTTIFPVYAQKQWTLRECIDYALQHNISLKKDFLNQQSAEEDVKQSQSALTPSVSFSTNHQLGYRPFPEGGSTTVTNGYLDSEVKKTSYNGSYGLNVNWTVWNGNKNTNTIRRNKLTAEQQELETQKTANSIQEQIAMLFVEILYSQEAVSVNRQIAEISRQNLQRGEEMMAVGSLAKADVAQLQAQVATDEYNVVNAEGQLSKYKLQLKQLLEITSTEDFDIAVPETSDEQALELIPALTETYQKALACRPEIRSAQLGIDASEVDLKIAQSGYMPTVSVNGSVAASTNSSSNSEWAMQMKHNLNSGIGLSVSVPIWDQRQTKTNIRKAKLNQEAQELELQNQQKQLWSTIEGYWLDATTAQQRFRSSKVSAESAETSFELINEQFKEGLKNIQELSTGKTTLLNSVQQLLETKYTTILDIQLLKFYNGEEITL